MNRRQILLGALVGLLVATNLIYWWPRSSENPKMTGTTPPRERFEAEDFRLRLAREENIKMHRDLFRPRVVVDPARVTRPSVPPPKSPEQLAEDAARTELAEYQVAGVVFRGQRGHAYLVRGSQKYLVTDGDRVGERFTVVSIAADAVQLRDPNTNVSGRLPVAGGSGNSSQ